MPGALSDLIQALKGSRDGVIPSTQAFSPLSVEELATELRLEGRGRQNGTLNQPPVESEAPDVVHGDIIAEIERRARKAADDYRAQLDLYEGRIRRALISTDQRTSIEAAGESALTDFKVQAIDDLNHLHNARLEAEGRSRELEAFRELNHLQRLPNVVPPREQVVRRLLLAVFVAVEAILNGLFFAKGSETGLIGGVTQALVLSLLNVGAAVLYARYGLSQLVHTRRSRKAVGFGLTAVYALWAVGLNLSIGHFRDLFIQNAGNVAVSELFWRLRTAPLLLVDAQSLLLVILGIGTSIASLIDAAGLDDLYPGYGAVGRRQADALAAYVDRKAQCLANLTRTRDAAIEEMSGVIELVRTAEFELRLAAEGRNRFHENYRGYLRHLGDSYVRLLQRYREANSAARSAPPPTSWRRPAESPAFLADPPPLQALDLDTDGRGQVILRMQHFIRAVNERFELECRSFQTAAGLMEEGAKPHVDA